MSFRDLTNLFRTKNILELLAFYNIHIRMDPSSRRFYIVPLAVSPRNWICSSPWCDMWRCLEVLSCMWNDWGCISHITYIKLLRIEPAWIYVTDVCVSWELKCGWTNPRASMIIEHAISHLTAFEDYGRCLYAKLRSVRFRQKICWCQNFPNAVSEASRELGAASDTN